MTDEPKYVRLSGVRAQVSFSCPCGSEEEIDLNGKDLDGATSVEWPCGGCGARILVYSDVDVRIKGAGGD